jgi:hypothetical protein
LPVYKPSFYRYFLNFENLFRSLQNCKLAPGYNLELVRNRIKRIALKTYYSFKSGKVFSPVFQKSDIDILKKLGQNKDVVILSPDKGRGVVLFNRVDYVSKMNSILSDLSKFARACFDEAFAITIKQEDKINRFLYKLKSVNIISEEVYRSLFASGTSPGILYGLAKVHKEGVPLRPILAAYSTPMYNIAKYIVNLIEPFTRNIYSVKNSYSFHQSIRSFTYVTLTVLWRVLTFHHYIQIYLY